MAFESLALVTDVESLDGRIIRCTHLNHSHFSASSDLCAKLHFVFVHRARNNSYSIGYAFRQVMTLFLDYVALRNSANPEPLWITAFTDITSEVFLDFHRYLLKQGESKLLIAVFRTSLELTAEETGAIPILVLPSVSAPKAKKTEPLSEETFKELTAALKTHVDVLRAKLDFRRQVENAEPYVYEDILAGVAPAKTRDTLFRWYSHRLSNGTKTRTHDLRVHLRKTADPDLIDLSKRPDCLSQFLEMYRLSDVARRPPEVSNPFLTGGLRGWVLDYPRAIKTFLVHGFPLNIPLPLIQSEYGQLNIFSFKRQCNNEVKVLLHRVITAEHYWRKESGDAPLTLDALLAMYYPTMVDMAAVALFVMLQSGWNKETVLAIDSEHYEHELTGLLDHNESLIVSEKRRSQGLREPYEDPKQFVAYSDKSNPYSLHSLIVLAKQLSAPLVGLPFDYVSEWHVASEQNPMFLCLRYWADWKNKGGRHTSISNSNAYETGLRHFLKTYPVHEGGRRLLAVSDIGTRLRPTWVRFHRKNNPLSLTALIQGHADKGTTDIYYDSSGAAVQERRQRLRSELESIVDLLRQRKFSGLLGKRASTDANAVLRLFNIPGKSKALWGCADQRNPTWPGARRFVREGTKCTVISKCLECGQIRLFEDSLPYLMERLAHLQDSSSDIDAADDSFGSLHAGEAEIIEFVLDHWEDEEALKEAAIYQRQNRPLLPRDLASLKVLFEE